MCIRDSTNAIGVLNGEATVEGSVKKTVADEIAKVIADAPESFDTLKEKMCIRDRCNLKSL